VHPGKNHRPGMLADTSNLR